MQKHIDFGYLDAPKLFSPLYNQLSEISEVHFYKDFKRRSIDLKHKISALLGCSSKEEVFCFHSILYAKLILLVTLYNIYSCSQKLHFLFSPFTDNNFMSLIQKVFREKVEIEFLPITKDGIINVREINKMIKPSTVFVSLPIADTKVGVVQPVENILNIIKRGREDIFVHLDAGISLMFWDLPFPLQWDAVTVEFPMFAFLEKSGILLLRDNKNLALPEDVNLQILIGLEDILKSIEKDRETSCKYFIEIKDALWKTLSSNIPHINLLFPLEALLPNVLVVELPFLLGRVVNLHLLENNIQIGYLMWEEREPLWKELGKSRGSIESCIRFSWWKGITLNDVEYVVGALKKVVYMLRSISGVSRVA